MREQFLDDFDQRAAQLLGALIHPQGQPEARIQVKGQDHFLGLEDAAQVSLPDTLPRIASCGMMGSKL
jgi:hypothetical protein